MRCCSPRFCGSWRASSANGNGPRSRCGDRCCHMCWPYSILGDPSAWSATLTLGLLRVARQLTGIVHCLWPLFWRAGSLIHAALAILSPLAPRSCPKQEFGGGDCDEAQNSPPHTESLTCAQGPIRRKRCLQRLLVHVLANRQRIARSRARPTRWRFTKS
jgi:hypothetical protein